MLNVGVRDSWSESGNIGAESAFVEEVLLEEKAYFCWKKSAFRGAVETVARKGNELNVA